MLYANRGRSMGLMHCGVFAGCVTLVAAFTTAPTLAQSTSFSIDYRAQTIAALDSATSTAITEGDILEPTTPSRLPALAPVPTPSIVISGGASGLGLVGHAARLGHASGIHMDLEVDALSFGMDGPAMQGTPAGTFWFSVDKFARGSDRGPPPPYVFSEGADPLAFGAFEASGDMFTDLGVPTGPVCPTATVVGNVGAVDGDGGPSASGYAYPGLGLFEPNPILQMAPPADDGDNVDAADLDGPSSGPVYFSLDSFFNAVPPGTGSAAFNGFVGGDVLVVTPGSGTTMIYAPAPLLGLDPMGLDVDDLDALAVWDNGDGVFQPSMQPYDWLGGGHDMVLFSVRAGSAVVGLPASNCASAPIEAGDILTTPLGGVGNPAIFIAAEVLGLRTLRTDIFEPDELDALDVLSAPLFDCDGNGLEDVIDIFNATHFDSDNNGVPDGCDIEFYCQGKLNSLGCVPFLTSNGYPSITNPNPFLVTSNDLVTSEAGFYIYAYKKANLPFQGGTLCVKPPFARWYPPNVAKNVASTNCLGGQGGLIRRDFNAQIQSGADPSLTVGRTVTMQLYQRDPNEPLFGSGLTNGVRFVIQP